MEKQDSVGKKESLSRPTTTAQTDEQLCIVRQLKIAAELSRSRNFHAPLQKLIAKHESHLNIWQNPTYHQVSLADVPCSDSLLGLAVALAEESKPALIKCFLAANPPHAPLWREINWHASPGQGAYKAASLLNGIIHSIGRHHDNTSTVQAEISELLSRIIQSHHEQSSLWQETICHQAGLNVPSLLYNAHSIVEIDASALVEFIFANESTPQFWQNTAVHQPTHFRNSLGPSLIWRAASTSHIAASHHSIGPEGALLLDTIIKANQDNLPFWQQCEWHRSEYNKYSGTMTKLAENTENRFNFPSLFDLAMELAQYKQPALLIMYCKQHTSINPNNKNGLIEKSLVDLRADAITLVHRVWGQLSSAANNNPESIINSLMTNQPAFSENDSEHEIFHQAVQICAQIKPWSIDSLVQTVYGLKVDKLIQDFDQMRSKASGNDNSTASSAELSKAIDSSANHKNGDDTILDTVLAAMSAEFDATATATATTTTTARLFGTGAGAGAGAGAGGDGNVSTGSINHLLGK